MKPIKTTPYFSKTIGKLPKGCQMCVKGQKLVLFITGICPRNCWYCPLSEKRKNKEIIFANEWQTNNIQNIIQEAKLCSAKGTGITGGDPLTKLDKTIKTIKQLKKEFGKKFHIHLYTSLNLINENNLKKLHSAGLDEIRFHPNLENEKEWEKINLAKKFKWDIGIEIPLIPKLQNQILKLTNFAEGKINFLNLNELEISDLNAQQMTEHGYQMKNNLSHAIKGSEELANQILKNCQNKSYSVHFCTSKLKDKIQMQNRFKRRAKNIKTKYDIITDEGLLYRGIIYIQNLPPHQDTKNLTPKQKTQILTELEKTKTMLQKEGLDLIIDKQKLRLITYPEHIEQFAKELKKFGLIPALIEEDPTTEGYEVNVDVL